MRNRIEAIGLDVDSSAVNFEGLNWLAQEKGQGAAVKKLTDDSMAGLIPVSEVMPLKMNIIRPSRDDMRRLSEKYRESISPDAKEVVKELKRAGKQVFIITGNFHEAVDPLAQELGIPVENVFANDIIFDQQGNYQGFQEHPHRLMHDEGKSIVIDDLRQRYKRIAHIGDSMGDLSAGADIFIGYGGAVVREPVLRKSDLYIPGESLAPVLSVALSDRQLRRIQDKALIERAQSGLFVRRGRR